MLSNNKSIDSYLESARKFKSPVSLDKARSLIEMNDLKSSVHKSFFSKIGIKTMTFTSVIISTLVFLALNFNVFNNISSKNKLQLSSAKNNVMIASNKKVKSNNNVNTTNDLKSNNIKDIVQNGQDSINTSANKPYYVLDNGKRTVKLTIKEYSKLQELNPRGIFQKNITGLNTIILTEKESADFGFHYDSVEIKGIYRACIDYWVKENAKAATRHKFAKDMSTHRPEKLPSEMKIEYIKLKPDLITDFDGTKRLFTSYPSYNNSSLDEFMLFNKSLSDFYNLDFNKDYFPDIIPKEIDKQLEDLQKSTSEYQNKSEGRDKLGIQNDEQLEIDKQLKEIFHYFYSISKKDVEEQKKFDLTDKDTNMSQVMVMFSDKKPDSSETDYIDKMAKMGIKVVYTKHRLTMKEYLKQNYPELETNLTAFKKQIDNFIMINKMVAIKIPYKNDIYSQGLIFWYYPSQDLIDVLPERYRADLANEFKLLANEDAICGSKPESEKPFLDIWRACSGAIENLRIFPNPVKDNLTIRFDLNEERNITVAIYDLKGNKVKTLSQEQITLAGKYSLTFNISEITKGMYMIVASSFAGETAVQRLIKE